MSNQPPIFIKGDIHYTLLGESFDYKDKNISLYGVGGLSWGKLNPEKHFGLELMVLVTIGGENPTVFRTSASITSERTDKSAFMGLKFNLGPAQTLKLRQVIEKGGLPPSTYMRKYPRLPAYEWVGTFPIRARIFARSKIKGGKSIEAVMDVINISPNGILIFTENPVVKGLYPGDPIQLTLEPRGKFKLNVDVKGKICRTFDEKNLNNGNIKRQFGIQFVAMDKRNRIIFLEWLKDILLHFKSKELF